MAAPRRWRADARDRAVRAWQQAGRARLPDAAGVCARVCVSVCLAACSIMAVVAGVMTGVALQELLPR
jgi:hypothetical protein